MNICCLNIDTKVNLKFLDGCHTLVATSAFPELYHKHYVFEKRDRELQEI